MGHPRTSVRRTWSTRVRSSEEFQANQEFERSYETLFGEPFPQPTPPSEFETRSNYGRTTFDLFGDPPPSKEQPTQEVSRRRRDIDNEQTTGRVFPDSSNSLPVPPPMKENTTENIFGPPIKITMKDIIQTNPITGEGQREMFRPALRNLASIGGNEISKNLITNQRRLAARDRSHWHESERTSKGCRCLPNLQSGIIGRRQPITQQTIAS